MSTIVDEPQHRLCHSDVHEEPHGMHLQFLRLPDYHSDGCGHDSTCKAEIQEPVLVLKRACQLPATSAAADCVADLLLDSLAFVLGRALLRNIYFR